MGCASSQPELSTKPQHAPGDVPRSSTPSTATVKSKETASDEFATVSNSVRDVSQKSNSSIATQTSPVPPNQVSSATESEDNSPDLSEILAINKALQPSPPTSVNPASGNNQVDFQSLLNYSAVRELQSDLPHLLEDQILEIFEIMDEDEDGFIFANQVDDLVFIIRGREQQNHPPIPPPSSSSSSSTVPSTSINATNPTTPAAKKKPLKPLIYTPEPTAVATIATLSKSVSRSRSAMSLEKAMILNDFVDSESASTTPLSPPPPIKRGFLITVGSTGNTPLPSPSLRPGHLSSGSQTPSGSQSFKCKYHVLDQGMLYHLDSNVRNGPVGLDKHGVSLRGHTILETLPEAPTSILLHTKGVDEDEEDESLLVELKSTEEKDSWQKAIEEHISYVQQQERQVRRQLQL